VYWQANNMMLVLTPLWWVFVVVVFAVVMNSFHLLLKIIFIWGFDYYFITRSKGQLNQGFSLVLTVFSCLQFPVW